MGFLVPDEMLRECCWCIESRMDVDNRLDPTDKTHVGYAIANECDYFLTTDGRLKKFDFKKFCPAAPKCESPYMVRRRLYG